MLVMKKPSSILSRILTGIVGLLCGGVLGMLALYFLMLLVGSDFGLNNVRPGFIIGGVIGFLIGLRFPERLTWLDFFP
jgi:hypothetical protein